MNEEKGERSEEGDKRRRAANTQRQKPAGNPNKHKKRAERTADRPQEENPRELLRDALEGFPEKCAEKCHPNKCENQDCNLVDGKRELDKFETSFKKQIQAASSTCKDGMENLFHIVVQMAQALLPKTPLKQKRFFNWMLQQQKLQSLLGLTDSAGLTPMHSALTYGVHDLVNDFLELKSFDIISIIQKRCNDHNCLYLAAKHSFPNLSNMISKCAGDTDIVLGKEIVGKNGEKEDEKEVGEDTPLHTSVELLCVPMRDESSDDDSYDSDYESDSSDDNGDEHSQQVNEDDRDFDNDYTDAGKDDQISGSDMIDLEERDEGDEGDQEHDEKTQKSEPVYRLEKNPERKIRLERLLDSLNEELNSRPRPPLRQAVKPNAQYQGTGRMKNDQPDLMELPPNHSVRLLVEACPEALTIKNKAGRTPYQHREFTLLNDSVVQELVKKYTELKVNHDGEKKIRETPTDRAKRAKREIIAKDPIAHYIRSYCMHKFKSREDIIKRLYKLGQECHIEFDLAGMPTSVIQHEYLVNLEKHLKFESILKYVALPVLSVEPPAVKKSGSSDDVGPSKPAPDKEIRKRKGSSDLVAIFDWLWRMGVREIIKVIVIDNGDPPHAEAAIIEALYGFNVTVWDWKRVDICSDVIYESSPAIKEVSLYSSGNNAVLMGWASAEGLGNRAKFPHLEQVKIYVRDGLEDGTRWEEDTSRCEEQIRKHWRKGANDTAKIVVSIFPDNKAVGFATDLFPTENNDGVHPWIESVRHFSSFLNNASKTVGQDKAPPVKIAIIDDGIDVTMHNFESNIAWGATFAPYSQSPDLVNSYYVPRGKHGTWMAQIICDFCPGAQLYIARLEELQAPAGSSHRVTARSAAKAVDWAISCKVDIISMSWTIQETNAETSDQKDLKDAIERAHSAEILMFCSASDQGANNKDEWLPASTKLCTRIGGATFTGDKLTWVDNNVDFWFPGRNFPITSKDGKSNTYESGSSIATAAASGLAGVLIFSARLLQDSSPNHKDESKRFQKRTKIEKAFTFMAKGTDNKFPRTVDVLSERFKKKLEDAKPKPIKNANIEYLSWDTSSENALKALLKEIEGL